MPHNNSIVVLAETKHFLQLLHSHHLLISFFVLLAFANTTLPFPLFAFVEFIQRIDNRDEFLFFHVQIPFGGFAAERP